MKKIITAMLCFSSLFLFNIKAKSMASTNHTTILKKFDNLKGDKTKEELEKVIKILENSDLKSIFNLEVKELFNKLSVNEVGLSRSFFQLSFSSIANTNTPFQDINTDFLNLEQKIKTNVEKAISIENIELIYIKNQEVESVKSKGGKSPIIPVENTKKISDTALIKFNFPLEPIIKDLNLIEKKIDNYIKDKEFNTNTDIFKYIFLTHIKTCIEEFKYYCD